MIMLLCLQGAHSVHRYCLEVKGNFFTSLTTNQALILTMIAVNLIFLLLMFSAVCYQMNKNYVYDTYETLWF